MKYIRNLLHFRSSSHGQSFVELALVLLILLFMMTGVVEFGMLLNNYLHVLDGTREGARLASQMVAFDPKTQVSDEVFYVITASKTLNVVHPEENSPVELVGNRGDDLIISVFSVVGNTPTRFPQGLTNGWSLCRHYQEIMGNPILTAKIRLFFASDGLFEKFKNNWNLCPANMKASNISTTEVGSRMVSNAFNSGVVLVEAYYNYPQMLKLPLFELMGDPIPVYTYSMMPMGSAMPTPVGP
jgi:hypothetical protein